MPLIALIIIRVVNAQNNDTLKNIILGEIVISANKAEENKTDIPQQIDIIQSKDIQLKNGQTTADVLQNSGTVFVQKSQMGGGSPVIRGFEANKVLLVIDGVRMNNAIYRGGHLQNSITIDPNMIERAEIIHGAGSVIYGSDAMGGVMFIVTKRPQLSQEKKFLFQTNDYIRYASANNEKTIHADFNLGFKKFASLTSITVSDFGDLRKGKKDNSDYPDFGNCNYYVVASDVDNFVKNPNPDIQKNSGYRQLDFLQKILFKQNNHLRHSLNFQYSTADKIPRYDRLQNFDSVPNFAEWYYGIQNRLLSSYEFSLIKKLSFFDLLKTTFAFQKIQESRNTRKYQKLWKDNNDEEVNIFSANLDLQKEIRHHELRYGGELVLNKVSSEGFSNNINTGEKKPIASRYPDGSTYNTQGIYFSHRWEIKPEKLILSDGFRWSAVQLNAKFDSAFFRYDFLNVEQKSNSFNWNLGLVYMFSKEWRVSGLLSTGFRNPNVDDLGKTYEAKNGTLIIPNADLIPEKIFYREASISHFFNDEFTISLTGYFSTLTDAIVVQPFQLNGQDSSVFNEKKYRTLANVNIGKAEVYGVSASVSFRINNFSAKANINSTHGKDVVADVPLDHIPPLFGNVSWGYDRKKLAAEFYVLFNGWKRIADYSPSGEDNPEYATIDGTPSWQTFNLKFSYQILKHWKIQAGIENILDQNYRPFASGINASGRNFVVAVRFGY